MKGKVIKLNQQRRMRILQAVLCVMLILATATTAVLVFTNAMRTDNTAEAATYRQGSSGSNVKTIQTKLKTWGYFSGRVDGIFGSQTTAAVKSFQRKNGLTADGIVGSATARALGLSLSSSGSTSTSNDAYLLARLIYGEARGEPYTGQVAVAAVVLNRVKSSSFPNSIAGVIYQGGAFDVVSDGQINMTPNDTALRAAKDALNGWDPTYGCLYYYNPSTATNAWIKRKPIHLSIGRHVFCV